MALKFLPEKVFLRLGAEYIIFKRNAHENLAEFPQPARVEAGDVQAFQLLAASEQPFHVLAGHCFHAV